MNALTVKLKNGEVFVFYNFIDFMFDGKKNMLTVICENKLCNYFSLECVSYIIQSDSIQTQ